MPAYTPSVCSSRTSTERTLLKVGILKQSLQVILTYCKGSSASIVKVGPLLSWFCSTGGVESMIAAVVVDSSSSSRRGASLCPAAPRRRLPVVSPEGTSFPAQDVSHSSSCTVASNSLSRPHQQQSAGKVSNP